MSGRVGFLRSLHLQSSKHAPAILTGAAVVGVIATAVLTARATSKALELLEEERRRNEPEGYFPEWTDYIRIVWRPYLPAGIVCVTSIACIIGANSIHAHRTAALLGAYSMIDTAFEEYKDKVVEVVGKNKEQQVRDDIAQDKLIASPIETKQVFITGDGDMLCYDASTDRYFQSNVEKLRQVQNDLNQRLLNEMWVSLNVFYTMIGLGETSLGEDLGWSTDNFVELDFSARLTTDNRPCIVMSFQTEPKEDYYRML